METYGITQSSFCSTFSNYLVVEVAWVAQAKEWVEVAWVAQAKEWAEEAWAGK